jgi:putative ABC transport system substrate-binding protein
MNNRRKLVIALGVGALAAPFSIFAQSPGKVWRIGVLGLANPVAYAAQVEAFRAGLRDLGYIEGKNIVIEFRWANGLYDRLHDLAAELVKLKVEVIVTHGSGSMAAKGVTTTIPIVTYAGDMVGVGLAASLARPGGNITGSSFLGPELSAKRLEMLREMMPRLTQVAFVRNPTSVTLSPINETMNATARQLKIALKTYEVKGPGELEGAFAAMAKDHVGAIVLLDDPMLIANYKTIGELAIMHRLPAIGFTGFAEAGGLMTSGVSLVELWRRDAYFVDKLLKGANPATLPIEQPTKFELVVNLKTAKAIGIKIPNSVLVQATKVIE